VSIPKHWDRFDIDAHDEAIIVGELQKLGHKVSFILSGCIVRAGHNGGDVRHSIFLADDGNYYAIKCAYAVPKGSKKEYIMWQIAHMLQLPGAYAVGYLEDCNHLHYMEHYPWQDAVIMRWVPDSDTISQLGDRGELPDARWMDISVQIGEWLAFCVLTDMDDRHTGNFVYSHSARTFAAIDMEMPFNNYYSAGEVYNIADNCQADRRYVALGAQKCADRIKVNLERIQKLISDAELSYSPERYDHSTPERILEQVRA
jgi:hypothetical protein